MGCVIFFKYIFYGWWDFVIELFIKRCKLFLRIQFNAWSIVNSINKAWNLQFLIVCDQRKRIYPRRLSSVPHGDSQFFRYTLYEILNVRKQSCDACKRCWSRCNARCSFRRPAPTLPLHSAKPPHRYTLTPSHTFAQIEK